MKKLWPVLLMFAVIFGALALPAGTARADEDYILVPGGKDKTSAPDMKMNTLYATSLTGEETIYLKFTTPAQKGFFDFYSMNISVKTHSWSSDAQVRFDLIDGVDEIKASNRLGTGSEATKNLPLLPAKTYYVRIKNYWVDDASASGYLKIKLTYYQDKVPDTMAEASEIKLSQDVVSSMDGKEDVDYFKFTTGPLENYTFSMKNIDIKTHSWSTDSKFTVQIRSSNE